MMRQVLPNEIVQSLYVYRINQGCRNPVAGRGDLGILTDHLTISQPGVQIMPPHYSLPPPNPGFSDLPTVLIKARQRQHYSARTFSE